MSAAPDIQIPNIEKELKQIADQSREKKLLKASLFTLILFAPSRNRIAYLQEYLDTILEKFPCRILFIQTDDLQEKPYLHVTVSSVECGRGNQGQEGSAIACDQITIKASRSELYRVPFIILPYLIPDLPIYSLWGQNPFEEQDIFPVLKPYITRVVFDSECSDNLQLFCKEMQKNLDMLKVDLMDINWALVSNWRDMLSQLFSTPEKLEGLLRCNSLTITYNDNTIDSRQHPAIRAIYLQGWLASRLGWHYDKIERVDRNFNIYYTSQNNPVVVTLSSQSYPDQPIGALSSIEFTATNGCSYLIARKPNLSQVVIHESSYEKCEMPFSLALPSVHSGLTFMKEIFFKELGIHYRGMLRMISQIDYKTINNK